MARFDGPYHSPRKVARQSRPLFFCINVRSVAVHVLWIFCALSKLFSRPPGVPSGWKLSKYTLLAELQEEFAEVGNSGRLAHTGERFQSPFRTIPFLVPWESSSMHP